MVDLSNWDFAERFTVKEAAALIAGIDPRESVGGSPIASRIYEATIKAFIAVTRGEPPPPDGLLTCELAITMHPDFVPSIFLDATGSTLHGIETLGRAEIVRWLSALGAKSVYQFDFGSKLPIDTASPATPAPVVLGGKKWTSEKLAELKAYRETHTMTETADKFEISEQRIRRLLPSGKPQKNPYSVFTHHIK
jgi:hypothetical protein